MTRHTLIFTDMNYLLFIVEHSKQLYDVWVIQVALNLNLPDH